MAAKMAVYNIKYKKNFPETSKLQEICMRNFILLIFELQTLSL